MKRIVLFLFCCKVVSANAQKVDSVNTNYLPEVTVIGLHSTKDWHTMPDVVGTSIYAGKKSTLIVLDNIQGNVATNTMRQVMAKVPGIHVWESDGSGIQIGVSARGLSPNRSWEFNVRQNGYDIAADPFGYPEAYYNPPLQAVQRIEVVRGQGALQYGAQFGGMVNYLVKNGSDINKPFQLEVNQTLGSNQLVNTYTAIGGETDKVHYYAFYDHRSADGWRQNSAYFTNAAFSTVTYKASKRLSISAEALLSHIRSQQPGGLTDAQFAVNSQLSNRSRNWMDITWKTFALIGNYEFSKNAKLNVKTFAILGKRTSIGFLKSLDIKDSVNATTLTYNNRVLDIDVYENYGTEARFLQQYTLGKQISSFSAGVRYFSGTTFRYRDGVGTKGWDYNSTLINNHWPRDIQYHSTNYAVFAENLFKIGQQWSIIPGMRYEYVHAQVKGRNGYDANNQPILLQNQQRGRGFALLGLGIQYQTKNGATVYANITQAYRPIQFSDLSAPPSTDEIDPNLTDAKGYNVDLGIKGKWHSVLTYDVSLYFLQYNNRIGTITQQRSNGSYYNLRTNVGNSQSKGIEALVEWNLLKTVLPNATSPFSISIFASYAHNLAKYGNFTVITKGTTKLDTTNLKNKSVENAPQHILRSGITLGYKKVLLTTQVNYVSACFADANNTITPSANGQIGQIPAYTVADLTLSYQYQSKYQLKGGINNLTNKAYFTRRAGGYPGPGLLPSDGRTVFVSIGIKI